MYPEGMFILIINHPENHAKACFNFFFFFFCSLEEICDFAPVKVLVNTSDDPF